jgi:hypothetical protein
LVGEFDMSTEFEVAIRLKSALPKDVDVEGNYIWWNEDSIGEEVTSWLEDLGFDVQVTVKEV